MFETQNICSNATKKASGIQDSGEFPKPETPVDQYHYR